MTVLEEARTAPLAAFFQAARPRRLRSFREFAEAEIVIPNGPRAGMKFRCDTMPFTGLILDEFSLGRYRRFWATGPTQSSKTLMFFQLPIMYHLFEIQENFIVGVPNVAMAQAIFEERILPVIQRSRYRELIPAVGSGSKGGKFTSIRFAHGAWLRFLGAGGGDEQRSSFTSRVVGVTEADKMDEAGEVSREADPVTQFEARTSAYGARARLYGECTTSIKEGRVTREIKTFGTDSTIWLPCPHCGRYHAPEREHFTGWQGAEDVVAARENGAYACPTCAVVWSEADRRRALERPLLVSRGQEVSEDGEISGEPPRTNTFGIRWNAMHSGLIEQADIAEREWRAEQSGTEEDERAVLQFVWALPYVPDSQPVSALSRDAVARKSSCGIRRARCLSGARNSRSSSTSGSISAGGAPGPGAPALAATASTMARSTSPPGRNRPRS